MTGGDDDDNTPLVEAGGRLRRWMLTPAGGWSYLLALVALCGLGTEFRPALVLASVLSISATVVVYRDRKDRRLGRFWWPFAVYLLTAPAYLAYVYRRRHHPRYAANVRPAVADALVQADHVKLYFPVRRGLLFGRQVARVHALDDVSIELYQGETLGLVGESGCGKTTFTRTLMRLLDPTEGTLRFDQHPITHTSARALRPVRREMQMVFQDPFASLNPRKRVGQIIGAPMRLHGRERVEERVRELLDRVGLAPEHANRFPHEFSGGQRQRIGIARALALEPKMILLDEPVSALDVSVQAQMINLLDDLQDDLGLTYLFVAHDLSVVRHVSDRIAVMYLGKIVELAPAEELYVKPIMPYTDALLGAIPIPDPKLNRGRERVVLEGEPPSAIDPPSGCRFHPRCPRATEICSRVEPPLTGYANGHLAACHHPLNVDADELAAATRSPASPLSAGHELPQPA